MRAGEHFGLGDPGIFRPASRRPAAPPGRETDGPRDALVMGTVATLEVHDEAHVEPGPEPSTAGYVSRRSAHRSSVFPAGFVEQSDPEFRIPRYAMNDSAHLRPIALPPASQSVEVAS